ncbi:MAG TPA: outer membrane beta-barrel protein [Bacteroidia bacterium]|nr:outer membrane beta-barrel protein [Bacteroidia bacterium]
MKVFAFIFVFITSIVCCTAFAQSFSGGVMLGFNASQVSGDNLGGYNKPGISGGFFVGKKINEKSGLELRMTYQSKGSRDVPNFEKGKYTAYYLKLNYVEVPIIYRYKFKMLWLMGGISGGYLINSSIANESGPFPENSIENRPFNNYEMCTHYGVALPFAEKWEIELKSSDTFFLLPIRKHASGAHYLVDFGQLNSVLSFSLKYNFK